MARQKPDYPVATWQDVSQNVGEYEAALGVRVVLHIGFRQELSTGGYVEVVLYEGATIELGEELVRVREPFPAKKAAGQAGAVLWAVSRATQALQAEPWQWPRKMRREAVTQLAREVGP